MPRRRRYIRPDWADEFEAAGHKIPPDGTIVVYHATTTAKAKKIAEEGVLRRPKDAPDSYGVYFSISPEVAENYGDGTLVALRVPVEDLKLDDIFPSGRMDFHAKTRGGIYVPLALEVIPAGTAENPSQDDFIYFAEEGWLGPEGEWLDRGNTHEDAAYEFQYDEPYYGDDDEKVYKALAAMYDQGWVRVNNDGIELDPSTANLKVVQRTIRLSAEYEENPDALIIIDFVDPPKSSIEKVSWLLQASTWEEVMQSPAHAYEAKQHLRDLWRHKAASETGAEPNPWLAEGWVLPNGTYVPLEAGVNHKTLAAWIMRERDKGRAFRRALKERWVRVGSVTVQLPSPPDNDALLRAVEHVRETSPRVAWDIRIEWWKGNKITSYRVPILEFMELESLGDLRRYPKEEW